jgi:geranylgeranyl pyrophosphate synthase
LETIVSGDETDDIAISHIIGEIRGSGALEAAEAEAVLYTQSAISRLAAVPNEETRGFLLDLLNLAVDRTA